MDGQECAMTTFDDREQAFERMFVHDEEMRFKALAWRNKVLGQWAAEQMGLSRQEASAYAEEIRRNGIVAAQGDEQVVRKLRQDIESAGMRVSDEQIREKMNELLARAVTQIRSDQARRSCACAHKSALPKPPAIPRQPSSAKTSPVTKRAPSRKAGLSCLWTARRMSPTPGTKPMRAGAQEFHRELPPRLRIEGLPAAFCPHRPATCFMTSAPPGRFFFGSAQRRRDG